MVSIAKTNLLITKYTRNLNKGTGRKITQSLSQLVKDAPNNPEVDSYLMNLSSANVILPADGLKVLQNYRQSKQPEWAYD